MLSRAEFSRVALLYSRRVTVERELMRSTVDDVLVSKGESWDGVAIQRARLTALSADDSR